MEEEPGHHRVLSPSGPPARISGPGAQALAQVAVCSALAGGRAAVKSVNGKPPPSARLRCRKPRAGKEMRPRCRPRCHSSKPCVRPTLTTRGHSVRLGALNFEFSKEETMRSG